ncbi:MAG TPA: hypothetical protein VF587_05175 [Solirubrobacteraceae bacterium]
MRVRARQVAGLDAILEGFESGRAERHIPGHVRDFNYIGPHERFKHLKRLFGSMMEYQFAVAEEHLPAAFAEVDRIYASPAPDPHAYVLKKLGDAPRAGLLSFPRPGYTLGLFTKSTDESRRFLGRQFEAMYPDLDRWRAIVSRWDPEGRVQSDLSRRLGIKPW